MNRINNLSELRLEIKRLEESARKQEEGIKSQVFGLKESLRPSNIIAGIISDVTGIKTDRQNFVKDGFIYTVSLLFQQFFLKTEKKFERNVYGIVDSIIDKIRNLVSSYSNSESKKRERDENNSQE